MSSEFTPQEISLRELADRLEHSLNEGAFLYEPTTDSRPPRLIMEIRLRMSVWRELVQLLRSLTGEINERRT